MNEDRKEAIRILPRRSSKILLDILEQIDKNIDKIKKERESCQATSRQNIRHSLTPQ